MAAIRKPFQGVWNVIKFNWHFYMIALCIIVFGALVLPIMPSIFKQLVSYILGLSILTIIVSTLVTHYIYDHSKLYDLAWLADIKNNSTVVNITAGFDETSELIIDIIPKSELIVLDFYDPKKHTEVSIKRARSAYPPFKQTVSIQTSKIPLDSNSVDTIVAFMSVHEIRDHDERIRFFKELNRVTNSSGEIVVTEHIRDFANFLAYNFGFFHFHSRSTWLDTFEKANLVIKNEEKVTPFITKFTLRHGSTH